MFQRNVFLGTSARLWCGIGVGFASFTILFIGIGVGEIFYKRRQDEINRKKEEELKQKRQETRQAKARGN